jgi:hypothetical protein
VKEAVVPASAASNKNSLGAATIVSLFLPAPESLNHKKTPSNTALRRAGAPEPTMFAQGQLLGMKVCAPASPENASS